MAPGKSYYRPDGSEHAFEDVPVCDVVNAVRTYITAHINLHSHAVEVDDSDGGNSVDLHVGPGENKPPPNPNAEPVTRFSVSRAVSWPIPLSLMKFGPNNDEQPAKSKKSNARLIQDLVSAAGLSPEGALLVQGQITWCDSMVDGFQACTHQ